MKKIGKFLSSMGFAVTLLVVLAAACALSSLVEQGLTQEMYAARYGEGTASLIMAQMSLPSLSCSCRRFAAMSQMRAILLSPSTLSCGI